MQAGQGAAATSRRRGAHLCDVPPKAYEHLATGTSTFSLRTVNAIGADPTPAPKSFTITR